MSVSLRLDQQADLVFLFRNPKALLLHEPGCGKTPTVCVAIYARWKRGRRTAWVMPKSLLKKNKDELHRFTPLTDNQVVIVDGPHWKKRVESPDAVVYLMGPDRFKTACDLLPPNTSGWDVDEYHLCYQGATSSKVKAWIRKASRPDAEFIAMTGTLVNGRLDTCWPAIHCINPNYYPLGHPQFLATHALLDEYDRPYAWVNHDRLRKIISQHGIRRLFRDIFGEQRVVPQIEDDIQPSVKQKELLDELEETAVLDLEKMMLDGTLPGVALIRAKQVMEHPEAFPDGKGGFFNLLPAGEVSGKEERLRIHLEDHLRDGTPFVIFSSLRPQQKRIAQVCQEMGLSVALMNSETSAPKRAQLDEGFRRGLYQGMVCSDKIAGVGYNWQFWGPRRIEVNHVILASLGYMDGDLVQAIRRVVRENRGSPLRATVLAYDHPIARKNMSIIERESVDANKVDPTRTIIRFKPAPGEQFMRI